MPFNYLLISLTDIITVLQICIPYDFEFKMATFHIQPGQDT